MKRLTVLRHAKSSWDNPDVDDFDRTLNDRGRKAAWRMGREFAKRNFRFDVVLASPAARVRETLDGVREKFELDAPIRFDDRIYLATAERLLGLVHELPEAIERPLLVGHNPGLHQLVVQLVRDGVKERASLNDGFPTAAVAVIDLPADTWRQVEPATGTLVELILPRELD